MLEWTATGRPWISVPGLGRVSSGDERLAERILCDSLGKFLWRSILQRPVRATLVILPLPGFGSWWLALEAAVRTDRGGVNPPAFRQNLRFLERVQQLAGEKLRPHLPSSTNLPMGLSPPSRVSTHSPPLLP